LEVGCADGALLYYMERLGWQGLGIEPNGAMAAIASAKGIAVLNAPLAEARIEPASFDAVYLGDTLEHLPDAPGMVRLLSEALKPGGVLCVRVPNAECGYASLSRIVSAILRCQWFWSEAPYHVYEFTPRSLCRLFEREGLAVVTLRQVQGGSFAYAVGASGYVDHVKHAMRGANGCLVSWALMSPHLPRLAVISLVVFPLYFGEAVLDLLRRRGSGLLVVARKRIERQETSEALCPGGRR